MTCDLSLLDSIISSSFFSSASVRFRTLHLSSLTTAITTLSDIIWRVTYNLLMAIRTKLVGAGRLALPRLSRFELVLSSVPGESRAVGTPGRNRTDNLRILSSPPLLLGHGSEIGAENRNRTCNIWFLRPAPLLLGYLG